MVRRSTKILLCSLLVAQTAAADVVMRKTNNEPPGRAAVQAAAAERGGRHGLTRLAAELNTVGTSFLLPLYEVDPIEGLTTLFAARNAFDVANTVVATYFDRFGNELLSQSADIEPLGVATRNIRDVAGLPSEPDGVRRGFALISADEPLSGDFFRVDPAENFASGDRLVLASEALCDLWDFRFLRGGVFSGGTDLVLFVDTPLGSDQGLDTPSVTIFAYDEAGNELGGVNIWTELMVTEITAAEILDVLGDPPVSAGVFDIFFDDATFGGLVYGTYSAEGRYSIGMHGTCY